MSRKPSVDRGNPKVVLDEENPEWTDEDFHRARPASELPPHILAAFPRMRGLQVDQKKVPVSIRLSNDVVAHFKSGGPGWQTRIDETLKAAIRAEAGFAEKPQAKLNAK